MKNTILFYFQLCVATCMFLNPGTVQAQDSPSAHMSVLTESVFIHETFKTYKGVPFPTNGLLIETEESLIMIDAGWVPEQTEEIIQWAKETVGKPITDCIVTHYHDDRTAGIAVLKENGTRVWATELTINKCKMEGYALPDQTLPADKVLELGGLELWWVYPGAGHSEDNIVIWLPEEKVLFGGCLIKSCEAGDMGYTGDADLEHWDDAVQLLMEMFPEAEYVIPGHQGWDCENPLNKTLQLLKEHND